MRNHIDVLDEEIAALFAEVYAVTARTLAKLAEFAKLEGYAAHNFKTCAHYLNWRVGMSLGAAREHVRVALALTELPRMREKFEAGTLSYSKVRALTRVATADSEEAYLVIANETAASQLEKIVRACQHVTLDEARRQLESRSVEMGFGDDGMFVLHARLTPEEGARVMAVIDKAVPSGDDKRSLQERRADALVALSSGPAPSVELIVHVDVDGPAEARTIAGAASGASEANDRSHEARLETRTTAHIETPRGERVSVSEETARRLACDASVVVMAHDRHGNVLDVGRRTRQIPIALRRALATRDGGCRYPGCANHIVDGHHIEAWADGGVTSLANTIQLCRSCHTRLHEGGFRVALAPDGTATFFDAQDREIAATAPLPGTGDATRAAFAARRPVAVPWGGPPWTSRTIDYGYVVSGLVSSYAQRSAKPSARGEARE